MFSRQAFTQKKRLDLTNVDADLYVDADSTRMVQVISNLLTNAAKFTEPGGRIRIEAMRSGASILLRVADNGRGISAEMLPNVFGLFEQERQSLDRAQGGLGLGLAIVKSLVEQHGGAVSAASDGPGHGSVFSVALPAAPGPVLSQIKELAEQMGSSLSGPIFVQAGTRVLVVDDNEDAADTLAAALKSKGCIIKIAHDPVTALRLAEGFTPDFAVLDLGLPVMDGYELAKRLRAREGWDRVGMVAVTGYGQDHDRKRAAESGFDLHFVKPVDLSVLTRALQEFHVRCD
jgi:CheY-like chemotaxis protein